MKEMSLWVITEQIPILVILSVYFVAIKPIVSSIWSVYMPSVPVNYNVLGVTLSAIDLFAIVLALSVDIFLIINLIATKSAISREEAVEDRNDETDDYHSVLKSVVPPRDDRRDFLGEPQEDISEIDIPVMHAEKKPAESLTLEDLLTELIKRQIYKGEITITPRFSIGYNGSLQLLGKEWNSSISMQLGPTEKKPVEIQPQATEEKSESSDEVAERPF